MYEICEMIIKNFLFHRISDEVDALWPPMKSELFARIVRKLSAKYQIVNLEAYLRDTNAFQKASKPIATILFDDGYKDNIEYAAPILDRYKCPASFYIVTDCIDRNIPTWTYIIDYVLQNTRQSYIELNFDYVPESFKQVVLQDHSSLQIRKFKPWMKTLANNLRLQIMQNVIEQASDVSIPRHQMMNWNEVKQLHGSGFTIGSHTHTHPMLAHLQDADEIEKELATSYFKIKEELDYPPETISYPIGSYDERVMDSSKKVGYKWGLAVEQKFFDTSIMNGFAIPRVELYQEPWWKVRARTNGIYNRVKQLW
jgi:peptidoglycan/xylan/chitin deacetylase (PgdA/CDA1 family)